MEFHFLMIAYVIIFISSSSRLLFMYWKPTDVCMLIFITIHLLLYNFVMGYLRFPTYRITSSAKRNTLTASFWLRCLLLFFWVFFLGGCLICYTSSTILNRSDESVHPCLVSYVSGKNFSWCLFMMSSYQTCPIGNI